METFTIEVKVTTSGNHTEQELKDFIEFELQGGTLESENPFVKDEDSAEITRLDTY